MQAHPHQPTHISEMMQRLGIEPGGGVVARWTMHYTTVFHRCEACAGKQPCQDWLDRTPGQVSFAPRFCPCADILFELQVEQPRADRAAGCVARPGSAES
jgi:hypothetical protein